MRYTLAALRFCQPTPIVSAPAGMVYIQEAGKTIARWLQDTPASIFVTAISLATHLNGSNCFANNAADQKR